REASRSTHPQTAAQYPEEVRLGSHTTDVVLKPLLAARIRLLCASLRSDGRHWQEVNQDHRVYPTRREPMLSASLRLTRYHIRIRVAESPRLSLGSIDET